MRELLTFRKLHFDNTNADKETNHVSTLLDEFRFVGIPSLVNVLLN